MAKTTFWLVVVWGDCEPSTRGPFGSEIERGAAAQKFRDEEGDEHGIYALDIKNGKPETWAYPGGFFHTE